MMCFYVAGSKLRSPDLCWESERSSSLCINTYEALLSLSSATALKTNESAVETQLHCTDH